MKLYGVYLWVWTFFLISCARAEEASQMLWKGRLQLASKSQYEVVVAERIKNVSAQDMVRFSLGAGQKKPDSKIERKEFIAQASRRLRFGLEVISSDTTGCRLRWIFRGTTVKREKDSWMEESVSQNLPDAKSGKAQLAHLKRSWAEETQNAALFSRSLNGATFTCAVSAGGKVIRFGDLNPWKNRVTKAANSVKNQDFLNMAPPQLLEVAQLQEWVQESFDALPKQPVKVGDEWQAKLEVLQPEPSAVAPLLTRKLVSRTAGFYNVEEAASFSIKPPVPRVEPNSVAYTFECQGTHRGHLQIESTTGLLTKTNRVLDVKGHSRVVNERGGVLQDEEFHQTTSTETTLKLIGQSR